MDADTYCREIEAHLCRKNDGHLIRIAGPSFDLVRGWAERGIPIKVVFRGVDRYFERYYAKGPRRRPVRIDFCEADVLDVFDEWRRAVGVARETTDPDEDTSKSHASLPSHLARVIARLTALRAGPPLSVEVDGLLHDTVRELDQARASAKGLRGDNRAALVARLAELDAQLLAAVRAAVTPDSLQVLTAEADAELAPFADRMPSDALDRARQACVERLLRERHGLPTIAYE